MQCVKDAFPDAKVTPNCVDKYPVRVMIDANMGGTKVRVWEGDQRNLFRKYAAQRKKSVKDINDNLEMLKEDIM
jgi:hypothetical protein